MMWSKIIIKVYRCVNRWY